MAATMGSETTAAAFGAVGVVRRDPFAMLPFCGYNMSDYFRHWLDMEALAAPAKPPPVFCVNWFRKKEGKFVWPGYSQNMRVVKWMVDRLEGTAGAGVENLLGVGPRYEDMELGGLQMQREDFEEAMATDAAAWRAELALHQEHLGRLALRMPPELLAVRERYAAQVAE